MPKAKKKSVKRTVTCGKCKDTGHNARTCPTTAKPEVVKATTTPKTPAKLIDESKRQHRVPPRPAPTAGNTSENNHAPYRCEKCTQVAILVSVRVKDHNESHKAGKDVYMSDLRCEKCFNKPPAELILKWGCRPAEVVPIPGQDA